MDLTSISNYYNDITLTSNYFPLYIRPTGAIITGLLTPSFDILKYKFIDETTIFTDNDINYLDKVSYEQYNDYTQTRNLYIVNSLIKDPVKTYEYSNFVLVDKNKVVDTISKGVLFNNNRVNYTFETFNVSYIYDSLISTSSSAGKIKSINDIMYRIIDYYSNLEDITTPLQYCYQLINQKIPS